MLGVCRWVLIVEVPIAISDTRDERRRIPIFTCSDHGRTVNLDHPRSPLPSKSA